MEQELFKYVNNFNLNNPDIMLKYNHSLRVKELAIKYSKLLNFNEEDVNLASIIGLLHDIGRFEQLQVYNSYDDKKIDHADYGVDLLFNKGLIKKFAININDYEIIKLAIKYHNKENIPKINDERILKHIRLIRDIDKIDIIYLLGYLKKEKSIGLNEKISAEIINDIMSHKLAKYKYAKNKNDIIACHFAYGFDIYNDICLSEFKDNLYYYYLQINNKQFEKIYDEVNNYLEKRIKNNVR